MPTLAPQLAVKLTVAEPDVVGSLAVFPLIADRAPALRYVSFAGARGGGRSSELDGGASVNDLVVHNPLDVPVLLYEGEEVLGAQQNRTFDVSVLVAAGSELRVPVSCVEAGRWDGARHAEPFAPAPQAAYPELRRVKNAQVRERLAVGRGRSRRPRRGVARRRREVRAPRRALPDRRACTTSSSAAATHLDAVTRAVEPRCSQVGALVAIGGRFVVLDHVSDVDAWRRCTDRSCRATRSTRSRPRTERLRAPTTHATSSSCCCAPRARRPGRSASARGCASTSADWPAPG